MALRPLRQLEQCQQHDRQLLGFSEHTRVRRPSLRHARKGSARTAGRGLLGKQLPQLRTGLDSIYFFIIFEALGSHFFYSTHFI